MPKIRVKDIEQARKNPRAFRRTLSRPAPTPFFSYSYFMALRNGIGWFHKSEDRVSARDALVVHLNDKFKSADKIQLTLEKFDWYVRDYVTRGANAFKTFLNLRIELPAFVPEDLSCGGQIGRVDRVPAGGYCG